MLVGSADITAGLDVVAKRSLMCKRPWTADLQVVTPPRGKPKPVTVIYPYYCNRRFLHQQMKHLWMQRPFIHNNAHLIVVDDCSPNEPAELVFKDWAELTIGWRSQRLFRIEVDVRWNWLAARNIGFHHAPDGWCLVTDIDHVIPCETLESCVYGQHDPEKIYAFQRKEHTGEAIGVHPNSWFMTREMFWKVGGYDENLSGYYGTDGDWRRRMAKVAEIQILTDFLIRHEYQGDSSTTTYQRKQPQDAAVGRIIKARKPGWKPKVLSFPYHEVQL